MNILNIEFPKFNIVKMSRIQYNIKYNGGVKVSTLYQKYKQRVVDGCFGHYKKAKININADNQELAFAA